MSTLSKDFLAAQILNLSFNIANLNEKFEKSNITDKEIETIKNFAKDIEYFELRLNSIEETLIQLNSKDRIKLETYTADCYQK
ncbi:MAG: hypothetical protein ACW98X_21980 [Promethearchaeota archaeon]|jgi:protoheme ferro-lyase